MSKTTENSNGTKHSIAKPTEILWDKVVFYSAVHLAAAYGLCIIFTSRLHSLSYIYVALNYFLSFLAFQLNIHLQLNRSFIIVAIIRILIIFWQTRSGYNCIYDWVINNRLHHKHKGTDLDPFNENRGWFFSYIGHLMATEHRDLIEVKKSFERTMDFEYDFYICLQKNYYNKFFLVIAIILPTFIPWLLWGETLTNAFFVCFALRYVSGLHYPWLIFNSEKGTVFPFTTWSFQFITQKISDYLIDIYALLYTNPIEDFD